MKVAPDDEGGGGGPAARRPSGEGAGIIRSDMARQNVTYVQLSELLTKIKTPGCEINFLNKVSRRKFPAACFFPACLS